MSADELIQLVKDSGLRGRGGAGFPTGMKWSFVPRDTGKPTYVTVNFDESEPGTCNNRELVEREPHALIEGTAIAARAIDCHLALHLHPRGVPVAGPGAAAGARRGVRRRLPRQRHHGRRLRPRHRAAPGRGRLHLRRGDGAALSPRGVPGPASPAAAVPGGGGPVRVPDGDQQRRDADERAAHREQRRRLVQGGRHREGARHEDVHDQRQGRAPRQLRAADGHAVPGAARGARRRGARGQGDQGLDPGGILDARSSRPTTSTSASISSP